MSLRTTCLLELLLNYMTNKNGTPSEIRTHNKSLEDFWFVQLAYGSIENFLLVDAVGVEPTSFCLRDRYSSHLS